MYIARTLFRICIFQLRLVCLPTSPCCLILTTVCPPLSVSYLLPVCGAPITLTHSLSSILVAYVYATRLYASNKLSCLSFVIYERRFLKLTYCLGRGLTSGFDLLVWFVSMCTRGYRLDFLIPVLLPSVLPNTFDTKLSI